MKKNYAFVWVAFVCLFVGLQTLHAQTTTLSGKVTNKLDGKPVIGATVSIPADGVGGFSDENGSYSFEFEKGGREKIKIVAEIEEYVPSEIELELGSGTAITLNITLLPTTFTEKEVVISATKGAFDQQQKDVPVSIAVVKQRSIDLQATTNVDKVITQIPGVDNLDGQLSIRGSSGYAYGVGSRVMVLLDGLPLLTGDGGYPELSMIPVDNISQVEVMKGASSVMYGSAALGGVINVLTGDAGDKPRTSIRLRGGFYDRPNNPALDWDGSSSAYNASAHIFHQRKIGNLGITAQADLIKNSGYRKSTDQEEQRLILHTKYAPKSIPGLVTGVNLTYRRDSSGSSIFYDRYFPTTDTILTQGNSVFLSNLNTTIANPGTTNPKATAGNTLNPQLPIDTAYQSYGGGLTPNTGAGVFRKQLNTRFAVDPFIKYLTPNGKHLFWYRGRYLNNRNINDSGQGSDSYVTYNDFLYQTSLFKDRVKWVTGTTFTYGYTNSPELYNGSYSQTFNGLYSQLDGRLGRFNLSLGGRLESVKTNVLSIVSYDTLDGNMKRIIDRNRGIIEKRNTQPIFRAGVNYELARATNVRASFGQAFRVPSIAEYFAATGAGGVIVTPNLSKRDSARVVVPETGYSTELGIRQGYAFGAKGRGKWIGFVDVAGFMMRYNNMMEYGLDSLAANLITRETKAFFATRNVADARIQGVEFTTVNSYTNRNFQYNFSGGITYIIPTNLKPVADSQQLDISYFNIANASALESLQMLTDVQNKVDNPRELKYRNRVLVRASTGFNYRKFGITTNYRYRSFQRSIDQYLHLVVGDLNYFRTKHPNGEHVMDLIFSYNVDDKSTLSLAIDNLSNVEYFVIPGTIAEQRKFTLQYQIRF